jgi:hypothetical protein
MSSAYTRKHRTHATRADSTRVLTQPADEPHPRQAGRASADRQTLALFAELRGRVPGAAERPKMLGVSAETEAALSRGAAMPVLHVRRKAVEQALRDAAKRYGSHG